MKGIIAELDGKKAVVLTQDGVFRRIKAYSHMAVGEEIELDQPARNAKTLGHIARTASIAAAALIALGTGYGAYSYTVPYSYVHVDINPSIELTVNIYDRIINAEGLNEDGRKLLSGGGLKNVKVSEGVTRLLNEAVAQGYFSSDGPQGRAMEQSDGVEKNEDRGVRQQEEAAEQPGGAGQQEEAAEQPGGAGRPESGGEGTDSAGAGSEGGEGADNAGAGSEGGDTINGDSVVVVKNAVLLTVSSANAKKSAALKMEIADAASKKLAADQVTSDVVIGKASVDQRNAAKKLGVTPGKLVLIEDAMAGEPELKLDDLKDAAVKDLLVKAKGKSMAESKSAVVGAEAEKQKEQRLAQVRQNITPERESGSMIGNSAKENDNGKRDNDGKANADKSIKKTQEQQKTVGGNTKNQSNTGNKSNSGADSNAGNSAKNDKAGEKSGVSGNSQGDAKNNGKNRDNKNTAAQKKEEELKKQKEHLKNELLKQIKTQKQSEKQAIQKQNIKNNEKNTNKSGNGKQGNSNQNKKTPSKKSR